jgi:hypothetical protein
MQPERVRGESARAARKHAPPWVSLTDGFEHCPVARVNARHKKRVGILWIRHRAATSRNVPAQP